MRIWESQERIARVGYLKISGHPNSKMEGFYGNANCASNNNIRLFKLRTYTPLHLYKKNR